jgi:hypothetical protein
MQSIQYSHTISYQPYYWTCLLLPSNTEAFPGLNTVQAIELARQRTGQQDFFYKFLGVGWDWINLVRLSLFGLLYPSQVMDGDECGAVSGKMVRGTGPSVTSSTTNPTWPDPGSNLGHHGGKPATNRPSYIMASTER